MLTNRRGASMAEYVLILAMVGFVMIAAVWSASRGARGLFDRANTAIVDVGDDGSGPLSAAGDEDDQDAQPAQPPRRRSSAKARGSERPAPTGTSPPTLPGEP
jgi:Flp pilus assembly pilin Flp